MADSICPCITARLYALRFQTLDSSRPITASSLLGRSLRELACSTSLSWPSQGVHSSTGVKQEWACKRRLTLGRVAIQWQKSIISLPNKWHPSQRGKPSSGISALGPSLGALDKDDEWEHEMVEELVDSFRAGIGKRARVPPPQEPSSSKNPESDWAERARQQALKTLELRMGRPVELPPLPKRKRKKKVQKNKKPVIDDDIIFEFGTNVHGSDGDFITQFPKQLPSEQKGADAGGDHRVNADGKVGRRLRVRTEFEGQEQRQTAPVAITAGSNDSKDPEFDFLDSEEDLVAQMSSQAGFRNRLGDLAGLASYLRQQEQSARVSMVESTVDSVEPKDDVSQVADVMLKEDQRLNRAKALVERSAPSWRLGGVGSVEDSSTQDRFESSAPKRQQQPQQPRSVEVSVPMNGEGKGVPSVAELELNKRIVRAKDLEAVLHVVEEAMGKARIGQGLSPVNAVTALHRVAKHMEGGRSVGSMAESQRLVVARRREMAMLVGCVMESLPQYGPQGISNAAWALSKIGRRALFHAEFDRLARVAVEKLPAFEAQHLANTAGSFAAAQHAAPTLFHAIDDHAAQLVRRTTHTNPHFSQQELSQLLWAHAFVDSPAPLLFQALDDAIPIILSHDTTPPEVSIRHLAAMAWAYAVSQHLERPAFKTILDRISTLADDHSALPSSANNQPGPEQAHLLQLHQVQLSLELEAVESGLSLPHELRELACIAWDMQKASAKRTSSYQRVVKHLLSGTGRGWVEELRDARSPYSLDLALPRDRIALEVDGPSHFLRNTMEPLGPTHMKRRHLAASNWTVVSVPFFEWDELSGEERQREYLQQRLQCHLDPSGE